MSTSNYTHGFGLRLGLLWRFLGATASFASLLVAASLNDSAFAQSTSCATSTLPTYFYDAGGRLSSILGPTGATSNYAYDSAGNILAITQNPSTTVQVLQVCPNAAPVGSSVTIWGTAFPSTVTVGFGGVAASSFTVISPNQILATIPSGAKSGAVTVLPSGGTKVSSPSPFSIGKTAPQVTGVAGGTIIGSATVVNPFPFYGAASGTDTTSAGIGTGTITGAAANTQSLTITGSGFDTTTPLTATKNKVWIGSQAAQVTSALATSLTVYVPSGGSSSPAGGIPEVTVETPNGSATYAGQSLLVTPAAANAAVISAKTIGNTSTGCGLDSSVLDNVNTALTIGAYGSPQSQSVSFASGSPGTCPQSGGAIAHFVAFMFAGSPGTQINAQVSVGGGYNKGSILLIAPDGSEVDAADLGGSYGLPGNAAASELYSLAQLGTYTLYVQKTAPSGPQTATVALSQVPSAESLGADVALGGAVSGTVAGYQAASFTFNAPPGTAGRMTLTTTLTTGAGSPFIVFVTGPDGFSKVYNSGRPPEGDAETFIYPGSIDFSGPVAVPTTSSGSTYTVTYQSLSQNSDTVQFQLASLPPDVQATGGCTAWPASGATASCSGTITTPGQSLYANLAGTTAFLNSAPSPLIGALLTKATSFSGCFEVLITDVGLNQQFYRSAQCGGSDFSYGLNFPPGSAGPYKIQAFGFGQNVGSLQFTLSAGPSLASTSGNTATFGSAGQSQTLVYHPAPGAGSNFGAGDWLSLTSSQPSGWTQCYALAISAQGGQAPFATYLQCPSPLVSGSLGPLQMPYAATSAGSQTNNYYVNITPAGAQLGSVTFSATAAAPPATGTIPINGSIYQPSVSGSSPYAFSPTFGSGSFVNVLSLPNLVGGVQPPPSVCFDTAITQQSNSTPPSTIPIFDTADPGIQNYGFQLNNVSCGGIDMSAVPAGAPLSSAMPGTVTFTPTATTPPASGNFGLTLYNYNTQAASQTLSLATSGPSGLALASTLPGQPVSVNFTTAATSTYGRVVVGLDASLAAYSAWVTVQDVTTGQRILAKPVSTTFGEFTLSFPSPAGDTYQVTVYPQGDAVGFVNIGVGLQ